MASEKFFRINGTEYPAPTEFTLGEMADMERLFGVDFNDRDRSRISMLAAAMYIAVRRVDESVTVDDIRALPMDAFETVGRDDPLAETNDSEHSASSSPTSESSSRDSDASVNDRNGSGGPGSATTTTSVPETSLT